MTRSSRFVVALTIAFGAAFAAPVASQPKTTSRTETATFAAGCFWCVEEAFDKVAGVVATTSGYTAGTTTNPTYEQVSAGGTGHTEAVQVTYDPAKVSYETLLETFWRNVDAVDAGGQFCDRGSQYRSGIYVHSPAQQQQAEASKTQIAAQLGKSVATEIVAAGPFYKAEGYHQDYYKKNPVRYKFYKWNCGRAQRLEALWGKTD
ncbi:MAG: peptide-methionine (S)-S-oxide reductase MsrA [Acidimicrobiia bacterium]